MSRHGLFGRISFFGNPVLYSGFTDESLNLVLRTCARFAHRRSLEIRVFTLFNMLGCMGLRCELFGIEDD